MIAFNWRRAKIVWLLWSGNRHASSRDYWGWVSLGTAIAASVGWGPWFGRR
jgi:hypothetical protein